MVKHFVEANLHLAVKLQSELIIQAILMHMNDYRKTDNTVSSPYTALRHPVKSQLWCLVILPSILFTVRKIHRYGICLCFVYAVL